MNSPLTPKDWELLSAYLDGQLSDPEKRQVQDLLALRPDLGQGLDELRRTRAVLRAVPMRRAPRNFTLTPAMVQKPRRRFTWGWAPSFGFASALATILLVLSFFFRLPVMTGAPAAAPAPMLSSNAASGEATPPIILWQDNGQGAGATGLGGGFGGAPASPGLGAGGGPTTAPDFTAQAAPTETPPAAALVPNQVPEATAPAAATAVPPAAEKSAPPRSAAPLAATTAASGAAATAAPASAVESGPILGIAPKQDRGKLIVPTQAAADLTDAHAIEEPAAWPWVQAGLAGAALAFGAVAFWLWRRSRH